jgi:peroxiredoxin
MKSYKLTLMLAAFSLLILLAGRDPGYQVGDTVSAFKLKNVDGKMISLADYQSGKGVIVVFDCNTCPVSKSYNERIQALSKKFGPQGFPLVAINANSPDVSPGDSFDNMVAQAKRKKYDFAYLIDESQEVAKAFGASNTPHVFVLKKDGTAFKVAYVGAIDNNSRDAEAADKKYVEEAVQALLANKPVPTEKTKAIGCGIKWKNA